MGYFPSKRQENEEVKEIIININVFQDLMKDYSETMDKHIFEYIYQKFLKLIKEGKYEKEFYQKLTKNKYFKGTFPTGKKFSKFMR